jgi:hypothetical protein
MSSLVAGKSAVVNALLGQKYLAEGILPTTNEINVLKHGEPGQAPEGAEQVLEGRCSCNCAKLQGCQACCAAIQEA